MHAEFGIRLPVASPLANPTNIASAAKTAEQLGYHSLWNHDWICLGTTQDRTHISVGSVEIYREDTKPTMFESLTTLAWVAAQTEKIKVGTAVLIAPLREPIVAAKQAANLDVLSNGRLILGVGPGGIRHTKNRDFENIGIPRTEKYERMREYMGAMRELWTKDSATYHGKFVNFDDAELFPKPVQKPSPPMWLGGFKEKSMTITAEMADGWIPPLQSPEAYSTKKEWIMNKAQEFGRDPKKLDWAIEIFACVDKKSEDAWKIAGKTVESIIQGYPIDTVAEVKKVIMVGSVDEVHKIVERYVDAGCYHYEIKFIYRDMDGLFRQLELFRDNVMSSFK